MVAITNPRHAEQISSNRLFIQNRKRKTGRTMFSSPPRKPHESRRFFSKLIALMRKYMNRYLNKSQYFFPTSLKEEKQVDYNDNKRPSALPTERGEKVTTSVHTFHAAICLIGFYIMVFLGFINNLLSTLPPNLQDSENRRDYPGEPLIEKKVFLLWNFYLGRFKDVYNRAICSSPGLEITLMDTVYNFWCPKGKFTGTTSRCVNLGSFNYLSFAETDGPNVKNSEEAIKKYGLSTCSYAGSYGLTAIHLELERMTAKFLQVDDAAVFGMGFGTNAFNLPCLLSEESLVLSDQKNHASLVLGIRVSQAKCVVFKHNNMEDLEKKLRAEMVKGQPKTGKPWKRVYVIVEGIYSMDGTIVDLPGLVALKEKYKFYIYIDEAHCIGAIGSRGGGAADYYNIDPRKVDLLMGTFSKSFAAGGGYIAGSKEMIDHIRRNSHDLNYSFTMPIPTVEYIISIMKILMDPSNPAGGLRRVQQLKINVNYFRRRLKDLGLVVFGDDDSPVVPLIVYSVSKLYLLNQRLLENKIAVVMVTFPITSSLSPRLRFCLSAHHTKEQLDKIIEIIDGAADELGLRYNAKSQVQRKLYYEDVIKLK